MRELASAAYWAATGALMTFGFLGLASIGLPFLLIGWLMAIFGLIMLGIEGAWSITIGLGAIPVYLVLLGHGHNVSVPTGEEIVVLAFFGAIALSGPVVRLLLLLKRGFSSTRTPNPPA